MSEETIEMDGEEWHFWRDYERGEIGVQAEDREPVFVNPVEARAKARILRDVASNYESGGVLREQADMLTRWADELEEASDD